MGGIDLVREIRRHHDPRVRRVPVVLLTAETDGDLALEGIAAGANACLHKPVSSAGVAEVVGKLLQPPPEQA
jgi:CheY-like chemotaxis protein